MWPDNTFKTGNNKKQKYFLTGIPYDYRWWNVLHPTSYDKCLLYDSPLSIVGYGSLPWLLIQRNSSENILLNIYIFDQMCFANLYQGCKTARKCSGHFSGKSTLDESNPTHALCQKSLSLLGGNWQLMKPTMTSRRDIVFYLIHIAALLLPWKLGLRLVLPQGWRNTRLYLLLEFWNPYCENLLQDSPHRCPEKEIFSAYFCQHIWKGGNALY